MSDYDELRAWVRKYGPGPYEFIGPCLHGRDPYTRCDTCGELSPEDAERLATSEESEPLHDRPVFPPGKAPRLPSEVEK